MEICSDQFFYGTSGINLRSMLLGSKDSQKLYIIGSDEYYSQDGYNKSPGPLDIEILV